MKKTLLLALLLVACKKDKAENKPAAEPAKVVDKAPDKPVEKPKPAAMPLKAFVELDPATLPFKAPAVLGKKPEEVAQAFPQFLKKEDPKVSEAVRKKTDEMMGDMKEDMKKYGIDPDKQPKTEVEIRLPPTPATKDDSTHVILYLDSDTGAIRSYGVWFRGGKAEGEEIVKTFDQLWGAHKMVNETLGARHTWFDAKNGIRASTRLEPDHPENVDVDYVRYLPLAQFFGEPGKLWGFEKAERPLIGATVDELKAAYGKDALTDPNDDTITLQLPPTDYDGDTSHTRILLFLEKGKVRQWNVSIPYKDFEPARAEYEAALDAKLGKGKPAKHDHILYGKGIDVQYSHFTNELEIEVSR